MFLKLSQCWIIWYLLVGFKTIILCSHHAMRFLKYVFFAKIWFVKPSTRIVKYESQVIKLIPWMILSGSTVFNNLFLKKTLTLMDPGNHHNSPSYSCSLQHYIYTSPLFVCNCETNSSLPAWVSHFDDKRKHKQVCTCCTNRWSFKSAQHHARAFDREDISSVVGKGWVVC